MGFKKFKEEFSRPIHVSAKPKKTTTSTSTTTKKKKKPLTRAAKLKADKAQRKADFDAHQKAREKKGQGKMTLKERQAADWKEAQGAAAKKHDEFQKKHKRGKYSKKNEAKAKADKKKNPKLLGVNVGSEPGAGGGLLGKANRFRKRLKKMSKDDLTIKFGKNKKK